MAKSTTYHTASDGQWIQPRRRGYRLACCDCGLIHVINFRLVRGKIQFQAFRHARATGQRRRWQKAGRRRE